MDWSNRKKLREHLTQLTKNLVRFPSHSHEPQKILELMHFIESYFHKKKVFLQPFLSAGYPSLVVTLQETRHPKILLSGHVDVVPSSTRYTALEEDDWLYGSGALDMKGGVAVMMSLMDFFSEQKSPPSLGIMLTPDEEIGGANGTRFLVTKEGFKANFVIINEGRPKYEIVLREKGILSVTLQSKGPFIHSAYPWLGKSAVEELLRVLLQIKKKFPKPKDKWQSTCTVTILNAGEEKNTIPGVATATLNIRTTDEPQWSAEKILEKIKNLLPTNIQIIETSHSDVFVSDPRNEDIKLLQKTAEKVLGHRINQAMNHGASDAKIFMSQHIPTVILGPVGKSHHSPDEALYLPSLVNHFEVLKAFIQARTNP